MHALVAAQAARASLHTPWHYRRLCVLNDKGPPCSIHGNAGNSSSSSSNTSSAGGEGNINDEEAEAREQAPKVTKIERRYDPWTGIPYTVDEFYDYYQQLSEWDTATLAPPLMVPMEHTAGTHTSSWSSSSSSFASLPNSATESAAVARAWAVSAEGASLGYGATSMLRPDPAAGWFGDQGEVTVSAGSFLALRTPPPVPVVATARHKELILNRKQELAEARSDANKAKTAAKNAAKHEKDQQRRAHNIRINKVKGNLKGKTVVAEAESSDEDSGGSSDDEDEGKEDESEGYDDEEDEEGEEADTNADPFAAALRESDVGLAEVNHFGPKLSTTRALHVCLPTARLPSPHFLVRNDCPSAEPFQPNRSSSLNTSSRNSGNGLSALNESPAQSALVPFTAVDIVNRLYLPHCALVTLSRGGVLSDIQHVSQLLPSPPNAPRNSKNKSSGGIGQGNSGDENNNSSGSGAAAHVEGLSFGSGSGQSLEEAFLLCGATAVVSPLWNSNEASLPNALLLLDFYAKLPAASEESPPVPSPVASALRSAQQWLKKASYQELAAAIANDSGLKATTQSSLQRQLKEHMLARMAQETSVPFASPEWWGSFRVMGTATATTHSLGAPGTLGGKPAPPKSSSSKKGHSSSAVYQEIDPLRWRPRASLEALRTLQQFHGVAGGLHDQAYQAALQDETKFKAFSEEIGDLALGETMDYRWSEWENYRAASQDHDMALAEHKAVLQEAHASLAETRAKAARRRAEALQSGNPPGSGGAAGAGPSGGGGGGGSGTSGGGGASEGSRGETSLGAAASAAAVAAAIEEATAATETAASAAAEARAQRAALIPVKGQMTSSSNPITQNHYQEQQQQQQAQHQEQRPNEYSEEHTTYEYSNEYATGGEAGYEAAPAAAALLKGGAYATAAGAVIDEGVPFVAEGPSPPAATAEEEDFWAAMAAEEAEGGNGETY